MKRAIKILLMSMAVVTLLCACASPPTDELTAAKAAMDAVVSEGAEHFTPAEMERINLKFADAMKEINAQDQLMLKNYSLAVFTLNQVKEDCEALKAKIAQRKAEVKVAANEVIDQAPAAPPVAGPATQQ